MSQAAPLPDPQAMSYEAAKAELKQIVAALEAGSAPLEQTLELWQRGEALAARCRTILDAAAQRLQAAAQEDGSVPPAQ